MKADAIEKIVGLAKNEMITVGDLEYSTKNLHLVKPPTPVGLGVSTLQAIADYIEYADINGNLKKADTIIHVSGYDSVNVLSRLDQKFKHRETHLQARCAAEPFEFGREHGVERFIVSLQAQFAQDETTAAILNIVCNLTSENTLKIEDNGITQSASVKTGIVDEGMENIPNPVVLQPFRTFPEVDQPKSKFIFRMDGKRNVTCTLHEADGGAWKLEAIANISKWIKDKIPGVQIIA